MPRTVVVLMAMFAAIAPVNFLKFTAEEPGHKNLQAAVDSPTADLTRVGLGGRGDGHGNI